MSHEEFRRKVYQKGSYLLDDALDAAIAHHEHIGQTENGHVSICVVLAGSFQPYLAKDSGSEEDPMSVEFDTAASVNSSRLRELIAPSVKGVRRELWGDAGCPFASWKDAAEWLAALGVREERSPEENARAHQLYTEWLQDPRKAEFEQITGNELDVVPRPHLIPYIAPDTNHVTHAVVNHGSPFRELETVAKRLADHSGFNEASVVLHILCDFPLVLPSIRITKTIRFGGGGGAVRVEFNSPDVTHAQIARVLNRVREFWGKSSKGRLGDEDVRFLEIIGKRGGVPDAGRVRFFKDILQDCLDEELGSYDKSGWRGPYMRWQRLMKRETKLGTKEG